MGSFDEIPFHVHVVEQSSDSRMMIKFRDYLRAHPDEARRYEDLKKALGEQHDDANAYANAKSSYVLEIVRRPNSPFIPDECRSICLRSGDISEPFGRHMRTLAPPRRTVLRLATN